MSQSKSKARLATASRRVQGSQLVFSAKPSHRETRFSPLSPIARSLAVQSSLTHGGPLTLMSSGPRISSDNASISWIETHRFACQR
ncbi:hypothetical protein LY76DRAFT_182625 [Colletotrichum caudatum]|nr:hypothetical protein LY76DRAFT_182625 [Colletotrichum caudatum]